MQIKIVRQASTVEGTPGDLSIDGSDFACKTLELPWRNNETGKSCIMPDTYSAEPWYSPTLQRVVLRLEDKHGRKDCLIHNANFAGDVDAGEETQVHGCTAVGTDYGMVPLPDRSARQWGITNSKATLTLLIDELGAGPHTVTYTWADGAAPADPSDHQAQGGLSP